MKIKSLLLLVLFLVGFLSLGETSSAREADEASYFNEPAIQAGSSSEGALPARAVIPEGRPAWLTNQEPRRYGDAWAIFTAGPYETAQECELALSTEIKTATDEFINEHLHSQLAARLLNFNGSELKGKLQSGMLRYEETVGVSLGSMKQIHARVSFADSFQREIEQRWNKIRQVSRLLQVGLVSVVVLSLLSTAFGYFKVEQATSGTRSANLQFTSATAILVIVVAGVSAARWLLWL